MSVWIIAAGIGLVLAALSYAGRGAPALAARLSLASLRAISVALLVALVLDAPAGRSRQTPPLVALDASLSWTRGTDSAAFRRAVDRARSLAGDTVWLFGDSLRPLSGTPMAGDAASDVRAVVDRAAAAGRSVLLVTDGELADASTLRGLPRGSRVIAGAPARGSDAAVMTLAAPRFAAASDTADIRLTIAADAAGAGAGTVTIDGGTRVRVQASFEALPAFGERTVVVRVPLAGASGETVLRAAVSAAGDREPRNDTLATTIDVTTAPAAVFVSSAPDFDSRTFLSALRGALSVPTRAYLRIAPGQWRVEGTLAPISEAEVRQAATTAGVLVVHGDTTTFGGPRALGRGALLLFPTTGSTGGEWYASDAPTSPAAAALSGTAWDSLPPLDIGTAVPNGEFTVLRARLGRAGTPRAIVTGSEQPRRVAVVGANGFWRWQFRGGVAADAFSGFWGGVIDFLAAGRGDVRAAVPADALVRAGEPIRWRRGGRDSAVVVVLSRRGPAPTLDSVRLQFHAGSAPATSSALAAGVYDVRVAGGSSVLVVNAARELLPRRPVVAPGPVGTGPRADATPRARNLAWLYGVILVLLCAEWLLRRRSGLR